MTEAEWLTATDPYILLRKVDRGVENRKRRLYECACCRRIWNELSDERSQQAVFAGEQFADGLIDDITMEAASDLAWDAMNEERLRAFTGEDSWYTLGLPHPYSAAAYNIALPMGWWGGAPAFVTPSTIILEASSNEEGEMLAQIALLRDIFGNPFRPVAFDPSWRTETVVALATGIYEDRAFERMPILADALEETGCEHPDILTHCREPGEHVRGCWVVDLVLGKE